MIKRLLWISIMLIVLVLLDACAGLIVQPVTAPDAASLVPAAQNGEKYGLIAGNINDRGFNQLAWEGMQRAAEELGVEVEHARSTPENADENIARLVDEGVNGVVTVDFRLADVVRTASQAAPGVPFVNVDFPSQTAGDLGLLFASNEPSFLAGYLAAGMTETGTVCTYGGVQGLPVLIFMVGFENGVKYYNQQKDAGVELLGWQTDPTVPAGGEGVFAGTFTDQAEGRRIAEEFFEQGCDIIFPVAGAVGLGSAEAAQEQGLTVIGVDADQAETAPELAGVYLTSVLKQIDVGVFAAIKQIQESAFEGGENFVGTLENEGVGLAPFHSYEDKVPAALQDELDEIRQGIIDGVISTGWPIVQSASVTRRLTLDQLQNASYPSELTESRTAVLTEGEYREPAAPGAAVETVVRLSDTVAFGDLNDDGFEDAAVVLVSSSGGSGTFYNLIAVLDRQAEPVAVTSEYLGDRIELNSLTIEMGEIVVEMVIQGPDDPMCCPTQEVTETFNLEYSLARQVGSDAAGTYSTTLPAASSPGRDVTLTLDPEGTASLSTNYLNDEPPIVEIGTWEANDDNTITLFLTGREGGRDYVEPDRITFEIGEGELNAVAYDQSLYGSEGLSLQKE